MKKLTHILFFVLAFNCLSIAQGVWTPVASFTGGVNEQSGFAINGYGYICGASSTDHYQYDPVSDTWTTKSPFIGGPRNSSASFVIGNTGYIGTGGSYADLYAYDAVTDTWTQKANFPGPGREGAVATAAAGKGYMGLGGSYYSDWYEYDPVSNTWTTKASLPAQGRYHAVAFSLNNKVYVVGGFGNGVFFNDVWEYDPALNTWTQKSNFPGTARDRAEACSLNGLGYMYFGWSGGGALSDCWQYNSVSDTWIQLGSIPNGTYNSMGMAIGNSIYGGLGIGGSSWYRMDFCLARNFNTISPLCYGGSGGSIVITQPSTNAIQSILWNTIPASNNDTLFNLTAGSYQVTITDTSNCQTNNTVVLTEPAAITQSINLNPPLCSNLPGSACVTVSGGTPPYSYLWSNGDTLFCSQNLIPGNYQLNVYDSHGCLSSGSVSVTAPQPLTFSTIATAAQCDTCASGTAILTISGGTPPYIVSWANGDTSSSIANLLPGWHTFCVSDDNECSRCDSVFIGNLAGISDYTKNEELAYPNPFQNSIYLKGLQGNQSTFQIFSSLGEEVYKGVVSSKGDAIELDKLHTGIYVLIIKSGVHVYYQKLIKK